MNERLKSWCVFWYLIYKPCWDWWCVPIALALGKPRQEQHESRSSILGNTARSSQQASSYPLKFTDMVENKPRKRSLILKVSVWYVLYGYFALSFLKNIFLYFCIFYKKLKTLVFSHFNSSTSNVRCCERRNYGQNISEVWYIYISEVRYIW